MYELTGQAKVVRDEIAGIIEDPNFYDVEGRMEKYQFILSCIDHCAAGADESNWRTREGYSVGPEIEFHPSFIAASTYNGGDGHTFFREPFDKLNEQQENQTS